MIRAYVSIGSNIERTTNIRYAVAALRAQYDNLILSSVYESQPIGFQGDNFYNLVVAFDTAEPALRLAQTLRGIEDQRSRRRGESRFCARSLDLDLLLYDHQIIRAEGLVLPREELLEYGFMLLPMAEIAGDECHPVTGQRHLDLWRSFDREQPTPQRVPLSLEGPE